MVARRRQRRDSRRAKGIEPTGGVVVAGVLVEGEEEHAGGGVDEDEDAGE
jgi:hypothetical protein